MIFQDRKANDINRKKIKIISQSGTEIVADVERDDNPSILGTAVNAELFNQVQQEINSAVNTANSSMITASQASSIANSIKNYIDLLKKGLTSLERYSDSKAGWANGKIADIPIGFGLEFDEESLVKFCSSYGSVNMVIDGTIYVNEGQDKVLSSKNWSTSQDSDGSLIFTYN